MVGKTKKSLRELKSIAESTVAPTSITKKRKELEPEVISSIVPIVEEKSKKVSKKNESASSSRLSLAEQRKKAEEWAISQNIEVSSKKVEIKPTISPVRSILSSSSVSHLTKSVKASRNSLSNRRASVSSVSSNYHNEDDEENEDESYSIDMAARLSQPRESYHQKKDVPPFSSLTTINNRTMVSSSSSSENVSKTLFSMESKPSDEIPKLKPHQIKVNDQNDLTYGPVISYLLFVLSVFMATSFCAVTWKDEILLFLSSLQKWIAVDAYHQLKSWNVINKMMTNPSSFMSLFQDHHLVWIIFYLILPIFSLTFSSIGFMLLLKSRRSVSSADSTGSIVAIKETLESTESVETIPSTSTELSPSTESFYDIVTYRYYLIHALGFIALGFLLYYHAYVTATILFIWKHPYLFLSFLILCVGSIQAYRWNLNKKQIMKSQSAYLAIIVKKQLRENHPNESFPIEYAFEELLDSVIDGSWQSYIPVSNTTHGSTIGSGIGSSNGKDLANIKMDEISSALLTNQTTDFIPSLSRSKLTSLWSSIKEMIEQDKRVQVVNMIINGGNKKCWRHVTASTPNKPTTSLLSSSSSWFGIKS